LHVAGRDDVRHDVPDLDSVVLFRQGLRGACRHRCSLQTTPPPGSAGGLANAIVGSALIVGVATLVATPIGILAGIYLAEYGRKGWVARYTLHQRHPAVGAVYRARAFRLSRYTL
jgi:hypothetical protein